MPEGSVQDTVTLFLNRYTSLTGPFLRAETSHMVASGLQQILIHASDKITSSTLIQELLIISYIAKFESDISVEYHNSDLWKNVYNEMLLLSRYGTDTIAIENTYVSSLEWVYKLLSDNSWHVRQQGLSVLFDLITHLKGSDKGSDKKSILLSKLGSCYEALLVLLSYGQVWTGQERVYDLISSVTQLLSESTLSYIDYTNTEDLKEIVTYSTSSTSSAGRSAVYDSYNLASLVQEIGYHRDETLNLSGSGSLTTAGTDSSVSKATENMPEWRVSMKALLVKLIEETKRGDGEYKLAVARCLSSMPLVKITSSNLRLFIGILPDFCRLIGATETQLDSQKVLLSLQAYRVVSSTVAAPSTGTGTTTPISVASKVVKTYPKKNTADMFGSRYGSTPATTCKGGRVTVKRMKMTTTTVKQEKEKEDEAFSASVTVESATEASTTPVTITSNQGPSSESVITTALTLTPAPTPTHIPLESPAFRMTLLDCLIKGWPAASYPLTWLSTKYDGQASEAQFKDLLYTREILILWCVHTLQHDVWTLKKAALSLLGRIFIISDKVQAYLSINTTSTTANGINGLGLGDPQVKQDLMNTLLLLISTNATVAKHSALRLACYDCLSLMFDASIATASESFWVPYEASVEALLGILATTTNTYDPSTTSTATATTSSTAINTTSTDVSVSYTVAQNKASFTETNTDVLDKIGKDKAGWYEIKRRIARM